MPFGCLFCNKVEKTEKGVVTRNKQRLEQKGEGIFDQVATRLGQVPQRLGNVALAGLWLNP